MIYTSAEALDFPRNVTLTELLINYNLNNTPEDKPAIIDGISGETVFTYATFRSAVKKLARHLSHEVRIRPGDVVGILSTNKASDLRTGYSLIHSMKTAHKTLIELLSRLRPWHPRHRSRGLRIEPSL